MLQLGALLLLSGLAASSLRLQAGLAQCADADGAVSVLIGLGSSAGLAVISCILFHFLQLLLDSLLAPRLRR